jgi:GT2 family glycosyltransferase
MILRRAALSQTGCLDEDYFIYSEEVDLCHRLRQVGWLIFWVPRAVVVHHGGQSTRQVAAAMFLRLYESKVMYFRKRHGPRVAAAYKLILLTATLARLLVSPLAWVIQPSARPQRLNLAGNYQRLLLALPGL